MRQRGASNALTYILQSAGDSAGGILALTTGRTLPNQLPSMANTYGLLLGSGVRSMSKFGNCGKCRNSANLFSTAYGVLCGECINKIEREVNY
jgi:hypothetical protein